MKKVGILVASVALGSVLIIPSVSAQEGRPPCEPEQSTRISAPTPGSRVDRAFTITGQTAQRENSPNYLRVEIDGQNYGPDDIGEFAPNQSGAFSFRLTVPQSVRDGVHRFRVGQVGDCAPVSPEFTLTVGQASSVTTPEATSPVSPSPSPSVVPVMATPEPKSSNKFPDWAYLALGALGGAALVGGAEYSVHRYHRKHPKKK